MLFTFTNLNAIIEIIIAAGLRIHIETLENFLLGKEKFLLLKTFIPITDDIEVPDLKDFYEGLKHNVIAGITDMMYMHHDHQIKNIDLHIGAGIFKEEDEWKLYIPINL